MVLSQSVEPYNDSVFWNASVPYEACLPPTLLPIYLITWWLDFTSLIAIERFLYVPTNDVILTPKLTNLKADDFKEVNEFRLYGR